MGAQFLQSINGFLISINQCSRLIEVRDDPRFQIVDRGDDFEFAGVDEAGDERCWWR